MQHSDLGVRVETLLRELVGIYSPSGKEQELCHFLLEYFGAAGIPVECQPVGEGRFNLLLRPRSGEAELMLVGHIDTVTACSPDQLEPSLSDGWLSGLGTADMKGGCAAMIEAYAKAYAERDGQINASLALLVGEEETGDGADALLDKEHPKLAVVGEPTDLTYCPSHFGYLEVHVETVGTRRHAAEASPRNNAVFGMLRALTRLTEALDERDHAVICNIRDLQSSTSGFAVPDRCAAWLDLHVPPHVEPTAMADDVRSLLAESDQAEPGTILDPTFPTAHRGYALPETCRLDKAFRSIWAQSGRPWKRGVFQSHSDANRFRETGCEPVMCGPGRLADAHTTTERVRLDQVIEAARVYSMLLERI